MGFVLSSVHRAPVQTVDRWTDANGTWYFTLPYVLQLFADPAASLLLFIFLCCCFELLCWCCAVVAVLLSLFRLLPCSHLVFRAHWLCQVFFTFFVRMPAVDHP